MHLVLLAIYVALVVLASLGGGGIANVVRLTHARMQLALSFVAGVMLGVGLLHMLPHALLALDDAVIAVWCALAGFLVMFFLQRFFHVHQHASPDEKEEATGALVQLAEQASLPVGALVGEAACHHGDAHRQHGHAHAHPPHGDRRPPPAAFSWTGAAIGLALHSIVDGVALAAGLEGEKHAAHGAGFPGLAIFLAVILHKPFDSLTITTLMAVGGWSPGSRWIVNIAYALTIPVGVGLFYVGALGASGFAAAFLGCVLGFSAGVFLCIAASDLLPEVQFHAHDRFKLSFALLLGVGLAWGIETFSHSHEHGHGQPAGEHHGHEHPHH
jgi:zinc and cadmium transporter